MFLKCFDDLLGYLVGARLPAEVRCAKRGLGQDLCDGSHNGFARFGVPEALEHYGTGPDLAYRVRHAPASDVGCRAVYGLEHGRELTLRVEVGGGCYPDASRDRSSQVAQDVAEEVGGDHYVEAARVAHERG